MTDNLIIEQETGTVEVNGEETTVNVTSDVHEVNVTGSIDTLELIYPDTPVVVIGGNGDGSGGGISAPQDVYPWLIYADDPYAASFADKGVSNNGTDKAWLGVRGNNLKPSGIVGLDITSNADLEGFSWTKLTGTGPQVDIEDLGDGSFRITIGNETIVLQDGNNGEIPTITDNGDGTYTISNSLGESITVADGEDGETPLKGTDYFDGNNGDYVSYVFINSIDQPNTPTGGTFNGTAETFPSGTTDVRQPLPSPEHRRWISERRYKHNAIDDTWSVRKDWTAFELDFEKGEDGESPTVKVLLVSAGVYEVTIGEETIILRDGEDGGPGEIPTITDNGDGTYTISNSTGDTVTVSDGKDGKSPVKGIDYFDGNNGDYVSFVYKNAINRPPRPTGGSYNGSTETFPAGTSDVPEPLSSSTYKRWVSTNRYAHDSETDTWDQRSEWSTFELHFEKGEKGDSAVGETGARGIGDHVRYVNRDSWSDTEAVLALPDGEPLAGDRVTLFNNIEYVETRYWDGLIWNENVQKIINGALVVNGDAIIPQIFGNDITVSQSVTAKNAGNRASMSATGDYVFLATRNDKAIFAIGGTQDIVDGNALKPKSIVGSALSQDAIDTIRTTLGITDPNTGGSKEVTFTFREDLLGTRGTISNFTHGNDPMFVSTSLEGYWEVDRIEDTFDVDIQIVGEVSIAGANSWTELFTYAPNKQIGTFRDSTGPDTYQDRYYVQINGEKVHSIPASYPQDSYDFRLRVTTGTSIETCTGTFSVRENARGQVSELEDNPSFTRINIGSGSLYSFGDELNISATSLKWNSDLVMSAKYSAGHWGLTPNGEENAYIRTPKSGLLPYQSGGDSRLGTSSWPFTYIHGDTVLTDKLDFNNGASVTPLTTNLRIQTSAGYIDIGPANNGWAHFYTDRGRFYFDNKIDVRDEIRVYGSATYLHDDGLNSDGVISTTGYMQSDLFQARTGNAVVLSAGEFGAYVKANASGEVAYVAGEGGVKALSSTNNAGAGGGDAWGGRNEITVIDGEGYTSLNRILVDAPNSSQSQVVARFRHAWGSANLALCSENSRYGSFRLESNQGAQELRFQTCETDGGYSANGSDIGTIMRLSRNGNVNVARELSANEVTWTSDRRVKSDIQRITDPVEKLKQVTGNTYFHKLLNKKRVGPIAQEFEAILPDCVEENSEGIKRLSLSGPVALLIEALIAVEARLEKIESK